MAVYYIGVFAYAVVEETKKKYYNFSSFFSSSAIHGRKTQSIYIRKPTKFNFQISFVLH